MNTQPILCRMSMRPSPGAGGDSDMKTLESSLCVASRKKYLSRKIQNTINPIRITCGATGSVRKSMWPSPGVRGDSDVKSLYSSLCVASQKIYLSRIFQTNTRSPTFVSLPPNQNRPQKSDFQGIAKAFLLPCHALPPMERSEQVGTILELWFTRNNIFAAFPVNQKSHFASHYLPTRTVRKSLIFKEFYK